MSCEESRGDGTETPSTEVEVSPVELRHLIYASMLSPGVDPAALRAIVDKARIDNERRGVTGMLLHDKGSILQIMEGEPETVDGLFAKIKRDPRHRHIVKLVEEPIDHRHFSGWSLAMADATWDDVYEADTCLNDFFLNRRTFIKLEPGRAKQILRLFRSGRFHQAA